MRYLITLGFALLFISTQAQEAVNFSPANGGFSIDFSCYYKTSETRKDNAYIGQASCVDNEHTFLASYTIHKNPLSNNDELMDISIDSFIKQVNGKPGLLTQWQAGENLGKSVIVFIGQSNTKIIYRVLIVGQIQYQLAVMATRDQFSYEASKKFFDSFRLED